MTLDTFFEKFDLFADAPDAGEKLLATAVAELTDGKGVLKSRPRMSAKTVSREGAKVRKGA